MKAAELESERHLPTTPEAEKKKKNIELKGTQRVLIPACSLLLGVVRGLLWFLPLTLKLLKDKPINNMKNCKGLLEQKLI